MTFSEDCEPEQDASKAPSSSSNSDIGRDSISPVPLKDEQSFNKLCPTETESPTDFVKIGPTVCQICGAKANGYHYEVPSCKSCKTFFRRNVLEATPAVCKFDSKCSESWPAGSRRMCRACRFNKCVEKGMDPDFLLDPEASSVPSRAVPKKRSNLPVAVISHDEQMCNVIDKLMYLEIKSDRFRSSAHNPNPKTLPSLEYLIDTQSSFYLADRLGPMPNWPLPTSSSTRWDDKSSRKHWLTFDLLASLEYAKTFDFFHKLPKSDKILLMKGVGLMCSYLTQAFFSYSNKSDHLLLPDGSSFPQPPPETGAVGQICANAKRASIAPLMRTNITRTEYVLIKAIILCNASLPELSSKAVDILTEEKQRLSETLCTFCLRKFGNAGPARYAANLAVIAHLEHLTKCQKDYMFLMSIKFPHLLAIKFVEEMFS